LLAILQYRWSEELNQAASDRMRAGLQSSMMGMRDELSRELASVAYAIRPPANDSAAATEVIALRFAAWKRGAPHPELVRDVFVFEPAGSKLLRLNVTGEFESTAWPEPLAAVAQPLSEFAAGIKSLRNSDVIRRRFPMNAEPGRPVPEPPAFIYEPATTLVVPMVSQRAGEKETPDVSWLVVQLSEDQVRKQILPDLARRYFSGREGLEYDVGVLRMES
jgi:hypothetical protein